MKLLAHVNPDLYVKKSSVTSTASHFTITPFQNSKLPCEFHLQSIMLCHHTMGQSHRGVMRVIKMNHNNMTTIINFNTADP
jgi:hypothetical protein